MGAIYSAPPLKIEVPECSDPHFGPCSLRPPSSLMPFLELTNGWVDFPGSHPLSRSSTQAGRDISEHHLHHERKPGVSESSILAAWLGVCSVASVVWLCARLWPTRLLCPWFSGQEYWSGLPCPPPGNLPDPRMQSMSLPSPALAGRFFTNSTNWEAQYCRGMSSYPISVACKRNIEKSLLQKICVCVCLSRI